MSKCRSCEAEFEPSRPSQKSCSEACRRSYWRERNPSWKQPLEMPEKQLRKALRRFFKLRLERARELLERDPDAAAALVPDPTSSRFRLRLQLED